MKKWIFLSGIWMGVIFTLSSIPDLKSDLPSQWDLIFRKIAHMAEFGILTFLYARTLPTATPKKILVASCLAIIYAASDEFHQSFVEGRVGSPMDILIDSVGVGVSAAAQKRKIPM